jgi:hypothetical protein
MPAGSFEMENAKPISEKQWIRPPGPKSVKIKAAQRVRSSLDGSKHFAVRYIYDQSSGTQIKESGRIMPIPEFGAMSYNVELYDCEMVFSGNIKEPIDMDGILARFWAEVWKIQNGQPKLLVEDWFASELPEGINFSEFVRQCIEAEDKQKHRELQSLAPLPAVSLKHPSWAAEEIQIDHRKNVRDVCERLLRREYPQTYRALDQKASDEEVRKAFIADNIANTGVAPEAENLEKLFQDARFIDWLSSALDNRGHKVPPEEWTLATGWVKWGFYLMSKEELERALNEKTKLNLKGDSWRRKADRLGLIRARNPGRPENPNSLPPAL